MNDMTSIPTQRSGRIHFSQLAAATAPPHLAHQSSEPLRQPQAPQSRPAILAARGVIKSYRKGALAIPVLQNVDFSIGQGEFVAVIGPSGCGKSTLLHLMATLDVPDYG